MIPGKQQPHVPGVAIAFVKSNKDPEGLGRVQLEYPWVPTDDRGTPMQSSWARVARVQAGPASGTWNLPDVGDEVLVSFEFGDLSRPIVIGSLWNKKAKPPQFSTGSDLNKDNKNTTKGLKTKGGVEVLLSEEKAKEMIRIKDPKGNEISLETTKKSFQIKIQKQIIKMDAKAGKISIDDGQGNTIVLDKKGCTIKPKKAVTIGSGGQAMVLGDKLLQLFNQHVHPTGTGPSGPPIMPMIKGVHISKKHQLDG